MTVLDLCILWIYAEIVMKLSTVPTYTVGRKRNWIIRNQ